MKFFDQIPNHDDDPMPDEPAGVICPYCQADNAEYVGEAYEEEEWQGSQLKCLDCGNHFYDIMGYYPE